ncbi:hypothetical protein OG799_08880 [Micromonospora sp. NBC_00898]|uniref:hypothetical protein n=1 Tax=Micromonospora sp. NBC_00898 TaxID=2975981 RepID=UPI00386CF836|nr:hypothetical protein OG799_08880 [Micromonospora sp. NBC_00898]
MTGPLFTLTFAVAAPFWALTILLGPPGLAVYLGAPARWVGPAVAAARGRQRLG